MPFGQESHFKSTEQDMKIYIFNQILVTFKINNLAFSILVRDWGKYKDKGRVAPGRMQILFGKFR